MVIPEEIVTKYAMNLNPAFLLDLVKSACKIDSSCHVPIFNTVEFKKYYIVPCVKTCTTGSNGIGSLIQVLYPEIIKITAVDIRNVAPRINEHIIGPLAIGNGDERNAHFVNILSDGDHRAPYDSSAEETIP